MESFEKRICLSSPTMHGDEIKYIREAYESNWMSTVGENITTAEKLVCEKVGCKYSVALSCGTSALHLALKLAGISPGDTAFVSNLTFSASINPLLYEKAVPVLIDSEYDTWNMDPVALEKAFELYPETKIVIVVNLYGTPAKFDEIRDVCNRHRAVLIEDAAESLGAVYKGKQTGSFGKYNAISFNGNKIITGSSGGMLLTDDKMSANKARKWSTQSREKAPWYQHQEVGYNYRMSNIIAGVICGQMPYLEEHIEKKREIYERYKVGFSDLPVSMNPYDENNMIPNFWLSCMIINQEAMCQQHRSETKAEYVTEPGKTCPTEILEALENHKVEARPIWKPMHIQPLYCDYPYVTRENTDVSIDVFNRGICLPSDIKMTEDDQNRIIEIVRDCFK